MVISVGREGEEIGKKHTGIGNSTGNVLDDRLANYSPWAKYGLLTVTVSKILLKHNYVFIYALSMAAFLLQ